MTEKDALTGHPGYHMVICVLTLPLEEVQVIKSVRWLKMVGGWSGVRDGGAVVGSWA